MTENTISEEQATVIEEMQHTEAAPEPGVDNLKSAVNESGKDIPAEFDGKPKIKWLSSAGYVYVWDNRTGERSTINRNMLETQLKKRRPDGSRVFTTIDPKIPVKSGNVKCLLHPGNPDRKKYEHLLYNTCRKENLRNDYQALRHLQKRHPDEYKAIQEEDRRLEKEEEREFRKALVGQAKKAK